MRALSARDRNCLKVSFRLKEPGTISSQAMLFKNGPAALLMFWTSFPNWLVQGCLGYLSQVR